MRQLSISVSSSRQWNECPRAWWYRHVAHAVPVNPISGSRLRGLVMHAGLQAAYVAAQRAAGQGLTDMWSAFSRAVLEAMADASTGLAAAELDSCIEQVADLLASLPVPHPASVLAVERPFRLDLGDVVVTGVIDLALRTGATSLHLRDWKSATPADAPETDTQMVTYSAVVPKLWPWARTVTVGLYGIRKRTEKPGEVSADYQEQVLNNLAVDALDIRDAIERAKLPGENPGEIFSTRPSMACNRCPFRSYCPAFTGAAPLVPGYPAEDMLATRNYLQSRLQPVPHTG